MEEIGPQIFIEQSYAGVVASVLKLKRGLLIIDGPYNTDDRHAWQQRLTNLGGGVGRLIVLLDTHVDRLLGMSLSEPPILAHENALVMISDLPTSTRPSEKLYSADGESHDLPQHNRWTLPDMTYAKQVCLYWDDQPVLVSHQPGAHAAGSWVRYDAEKIIFIGDSVMVQRPPFLGWCQIDRWIEELTWLSSDFFKHYQIISGRDGIISQKTVLRMVDFLIELRGAVNQLVTMEQPEEGIARYLPGLLKYFPSNREIKEQQQNRLVEELKKVLKRVKLDETKGDLNADAST